MANTITGHSGPAGTQIPPVYRQFPALAGEHDENAAAGSGRAARIERRPAGREDGLGTALAWLSLGFGVAFLFAPRAMARSAGLPHWPWLLRAVGARELACGIGLLTEPKSPLWRWTRVAGDAMDMAMLGAAAFSPGADGRRLAASAAFASGVTALDVRASAQRRRKLSSQALPGAHGARRVHKSISVNRPAADCYGFWRNFESFPTFMEHVESVQVIDQQRSHWRVRGPAGRSVEWDAEITDDRPNELIGWRSVAGADVDHSGTVRFSPAPGGKGTVVQVQFNYTPPARMAGAVTAMLFGEEPSQQVERDLRRFKQLLETGEIPTTRGQSHGPRSVKARLFNKGVEQK